MHKNKYTRNSYFKVCKTNPDKMDENDKMAGEHLQNMVNTYNILVEFMPPHLHSTFKEKVSTRGIGLKHFYFKQKNERLQSF